MSAKEPMADQRPDPGVRQALLELQRYLSDTVAPLMVVDSVELLLKCPPQVVASGIQGWVASQHDAAMAGVPLSDYLFHALKKIHLMSEFKLIQQEPLAKYLEDLGQVLLEICPEGERAALSTSLKNLELSESTLAPSVEILHRQGGSATGLSRTAGGAAMASPRQPGAMTEEVAKGLRRFSLLLERLEHGAQAASDRPAGSAPADRGGDLLAQILATAAVSSRSTTEFERYMSRLSEHGIEARTDEIFRVLGRSLPGWAIQGGTSGEAAAGALPASRQVEAMYRIISNAGDQQEGTRRFSEMVQTAIEQFNECLLPQAATIFELAERIVTEKKLDPELVKSIRKRAHESLGVEQLRHFAERPDGHVLLRKVMDFFPALTAQGLMADLQGEERRDRRKLLLLLLEAHGARAREAALERLESCLAGQVADDGGFYQRNLLHLLRRIPASSDDSPDREMEILSRLSKQGNPMVVIKEAIGALGQMKREGADQILIARLREFEEMIQKGAEGSASGEEMMVLLDRTVSALARLGTSNAFRTVVNHAFSLHPSLGDTMARLGELSSQDLSADKELIGHLIKNLRSELPKKVLGFIVQKKNDRALHLTRALSGTSSPSVRQVFEEIAERYPEQEFGQVASRTLAAFRSPAQPGEAQPVSLTGDLDLFGLPNLLQTLSGSCLTGLLTLKNRDGGTTATMELEAGKIRSCQTGTLTGQMAVFQLFEKPAPGNFSFASRSTGKPPQEGEGPSIDVVPTLLEALRRHDEFQQARVLVPDDVSFIPTATKPTRPPDEEDKNFLGALWKMAASGTSPQSCEASIPFDSYRIRRLFAHWVEEGALRA